MQVGALLGRRLVLLRLDAMGVRPRVLADAGHLPGDLDVGEVGLDGEAVVGDLLARSVSVSELPLNTVLSLFGAPYLIWLSIKSRRAV